MPNYELTLAQTEDFRRCMDILNAGREFQRQQGFIQWPDGYPDEESVRSDLRDGLGYVLKVDDVIAAYMYIGFDGDNWGDGGYYSKSCRKVIEAVWKSASNVAIVSLQDMCGFGSDARMNIPGVPDKNWRFRTTKDTIESIDSDYFRHINTLYRRMYPVFGK